ncbi:MAG: Gfo/Idh/MocA family oxidoreductase [Caldilineaceae bacterium]
MSPGSKPIRVLLAGLGNRGRMWTTVLGRDPQTQICAAADVSPAACDRFAAEHPGIPVYTSLDAALDGGEYDAVVLVTFPDKRLDQVRRILQGGLPLLAEKPLSLELEEAVQIVDLARAHGTALAVGLNFRFLPVSQKVRELVTQEVVGAPGFGQFVYQRNRDGMLPHLNKYPLTMQHPMMLEQSIHHLDLIRFCYNRRVEEIACRTWNPSWSMYAHDSNVNCLLGMAGGLEVNYLGTWTGGWNSLQFEWRTDCAGGVIVQRELFENLAWAKMGDAELQPIPLAPCEAFFDDTAALWQAFIAHVREGAPLSCSGADHLVTLGLCFAAIESSDTGRTVDFVAYCRKHGILDA